MADIRLRGISTGGVMDERSMQLRLGLGASAAALFFVLVAIPNWVSAPSNVSNVVLSPLFWPYTVSILTGIAGLGLIASGLRMTSSGKPMNEPADNPMNTVLRMIGTAAIMLVSMQLIGSLGMVWTSMLVFLAMAFLVRTRHPKVAIICAVILPLVLYTFFAHVAGVAIPQGSLVRLP